MELKEKIKLTSNISIVSGVFILAVSLLLILNYLQINRNDVLDSKVIESLVEKLQDNPDNDALREEIRTYDLMARKAYFNSRWQVKTGSYLLLFAGILLIVSLRIYHSLTSKIEVPDQKSSNEGLDRILAQRWVLISTAAILVLALVAGFLTQDTFKVYGEDAVSAGVLTDEATEVVTEDENIQVIEISEAGEESSESINEDTSDEELAQSDNTEEVSEASKKASTTASAFPTKAQVENNYSSFRGPWGQGVSKHKNIPVDWDGASGKNILWKVKLPKTGFNSPIIWGDKLFMGGGDNSGLKVYCYNSNTGKLIWEKDVNNIQGSPATPPRTTDDTGLSAPSLTTDGNKVIAIFATGDIIAFDVNGNRLWAKNLGVPDNHYGHSSSLIMLKDKVYIQYDSNRQGKLIALNTSTGETVWETIRQAHISWSSPILIEVNGKFQVVLSSEPIVAGYDAETGKELWTNESMMGEVGPSPAFGEGLVFATNEYATLAAINPTNGETVWQNDEYLSEVPSPVVSNGLLFLATTYGVFVCYDAKTGEMYWEQEFDDGFYSSPVIADGKVFISDMRGVTHVMEVSKEAKVISNSPVGEKIVSTPAFAEGRIYIKSVNNLYCIGK